LPARPIDREQLAELRAVIEEHWGWAWRGRDAIAAQYARHKHGDMWGWADRDPRYALVREWFERHPEVETVLDFGCGTGYYAGRLANDLGRRWVCVDIDAGALAWGERYRQDGRIREPERVTFLEGAADDDFSAYAPVDCLFVGETLEHLLDPTEAIDALERWVRPGGRVLITTPYGPWEYQSYHTYPVRAHLWEYDQHDLQDLFGRKAKVSITATPAGTAQNLDEPCGWYLVEYEVQPDRPTGRIDMERKFRLQRPRQTVSAMLVVGPGAEETLRWTLNSLRHVADEVVLVDTGMTPAARQIGEEFGAKFVPGDPPTVAGFETPRNQGFAACRMDWVLWIDTDEKLIRPDAVQKYLRENMFNGYGIRQHHFACDTTFKPDMPVRLFRRRPYQGKTMRWYGMIHEHPELGLNEGPGPTIILSDVHIPHLGYLIEDGRRQRFDRNYPLLLRDIEKYPERLLQKHFIMRDNMLLVMYEMQQNGGRVTPEVRRRCEETIALYRQYFLGKPTYVGTDSLQYYSQACHVLGIGAEVAFTVAAAKTDVRPEPPTVYRFATAEDLEKELAWRGREVIAPFVNEWW